MDTFQWTMAITAVLGFLITAGSVLVAATWAVANIKEDTSAKIAALKDETADDFKAMEGRFMAEQDTQDHNVGEMGTALRRYIEGVEKEMHKIEIWGRDNSVLKGDFAAATDALRGDIRAMAKDIKSDFRDLNAKIDGKK